MASLGSSFSWCKRYGARRWCRNFFPGMHQGLGTRLVQEWWLCMTPITVYFQTTMISSNMPYGGLHFLKQTCAESTFTTLKKQTSSSLKKTGSDFKGDQPKATSRTPPADMLFIEFPSKLTPWFVPKFCFCWWKVSIEWKEPYIYTVRDLQDFFKGNKKLVLNIFYFQQLVFHQASGYSTIQGVVFSMGCSFPLPWSLWVSLDATPSLRLCLVVLKEASKRTCVPLLVHWGLWGSKYLTQ